MQESRGAGHPHSKQPSHPRLPHPVEGVIRDSDHPEALEGPPRESGNPFATSSACRPALPHRRSRESGNPGQGRGARASPSLGVPAHPHSSFLRRQESRGAGPGRPFALSLSKGPPHPDTTPRANPNSPATLPTWHMHATPSTTPPPRSHSPYGRPHAVRPLTAGRCIFRVYELVPGNFVAGNESASYDHPDEDNSAQLRLNVKQVLAEPCGGPPNGERIER